MLSKIVRNKEDQGRISNLETQVQQLNEKLDRFLQLLEENPEKKTTVLLNSISDEVGQRLIAAIKDAETINEIKKQTKAVSTEVEGLKQRYTEALAGKEAQMHCLRCGGNSFIDADMRCSDGFDTKLTLGPTGFALKDHFGTLGPRGSTTCQSVGRVCRQCGLIRLEIEQHSLKMPLMSIPEEKGQ